MKSSHIMKQNLIIALNFAISEQEKEESLRGYTTNSALLKGWKQNLKCLLEGGELEIKNNA